jgi:hypothetical protein
LNLGLWHLEHPDSPLGVGTVQATSTDRIPGLAGQVRGGVRHCCSFLIESVRVNAVNCRGVCRHTDFRSAAPSRPGRLHPSCLLGRLCRRRGSSSSCRQGLVRPDLLDFSRVLRSTRGGGCSGSPPTGAATSATWRTNLGGLFLRIWEDAGNRDASTACA